MGQWSHRWNEDCLSVVAILAMSQDARKLKRLARQFNLLDEGPDPNTTEIFVRLHEACHHDPELARAIARELDDRFRSTVLRARSLNLEGIKAIETNWALPLLWAALRDERAEVRAYGRYLVHALLWDGLRRTSEDEGRESYLQKATEELEAQISRQRSELVSLREELPRKSAENERLQKLIMAGKYRPELIRPEEPGEGRLLREIRKLRHDLERKRERIEDLEKILGGSALSLPEMPSLEADLKARCEDPRNCLLQNRSLSWDKDHQCTGKNECCKECPLEGLRVAVVGGISKMLPGYREVVRQLGAELLFHDGEVRNGSHKLKSLVCGADIVVFITSVNSHGALSVVRAVCKKKGKKFIALKETGSESLARTLRNCAA